MLALLNAPKPTLTLVRTAAHDVENNQDVLLWRAERVRQWLDAHVQVQLPEETVVRRATDLLASGFKKFDALHVASAEMASVEVFVTCDDRLLAAARRQAALLRVRVVNPIDLIAEVFP